MYFNPTYACQTNVIKPLNIALIILLSIWMIYNHKISKIQSIYSITTLTYIMYLSLQLWENLPHNFLGHLFIDKCIYVTLYHKNHGYLKAKRIQHVIGNILWQLEHAGETNIGAQDTRNTYGTKLQRSLNGLKQSRRMWYKRLREYLPKQDYVNNEVCLCGLIKKLLNGFIIIVVYVDDMNIIGHQKSLIKLVHFSWKNLKWKI